MNRSHSPVFHILRALSKEQMRALDKFIRSPYFVTHEGVLQLYELYKRNLDSAVLDKRAIEKALFPEGNLPDPRRVYHLNNYLLEAVENFLVQESWKEREHERNAAVIESLRRLKLLDHTASMARYAQKKLRGDKYRGPEYHRAEFRLQMEAYYGSLQQGRAKSFNVQELSDAQDVALICEKLHMGCLLLSHEAVARQTYDKGLLDSVLRYLEGHPYLDIPAVAAYYHGYYAQLGGADAAQHFSQLKKILEDHAPHFTLAETHDLYLMAINFCIRRINQRQEQYIREVFELYQSGLRYGALLEDGMLSRWTYNNITATGLRLQAFEQVYRFLQDYAPLLPEEHRKGAFNFNMARYYYELGQRQNAMQHLLGIEYDDVLQNLDAKIMLSKIYYELDELDSLENQLDSIQIYVRRKKVLGYHRDSYLSLTRYFRKLLKINWNSKAEIAGLRQAIQEERLLPEREWLLKQTLLQET